MPDILADLQGVTKLNGDTYSSAEVLGMIVRAGVEIERLRAALVEISEPIQAMQRRADEDGSHLDGAMAVNLANDAYYLRQIAKRTINEQETRETK